MLVLKLHLSCENFQKKKPKKIQKIHIVVFIVRSCTSFTQNSFTSKYHWKFTEDILENTRDRVLSESTTRELSWKISQYSQETPVLESLFKKIADLEPVNTAKYYNNCEYCEFFRTPFL